MGKLTDYNYQKLEERIRYSLDNTSSSFYEELKKIKGNTLITGVGGSMVVSLFLSKVLESKNHILCAVEEISSIYSKNLEGFQNLVVVSSSGKNNGVKQILDYGNTKKYLVTASTKNKPNVEYLTYATLDKEDSFISLAATLVPISILVHYYNDEKFCYENKKMDFFSNLDLHLDFEVFYDYKSMVTAHFLESTFVEAGLASIILHDKYSYCHGRSTLGSKRKSNLLYLLSDTKDLDNLLLANLHLVYDHILILQSDFTDSILADYDLLCQAFSFVYELSQKLKRDLSKVKYAKIVPKIYHFKGSM